MRRTKCLNFWLLMFFGFIVITTFPPGCCYLNRGNLISVENNCKEVLTAIEISYQGGMLKIPQLNPGAVFKKRIKPSTETDLIVRWSDSAGNRYKCTDLVYLSSVDDDSVHILLKAKGQIEVIISPSVVGHFQEMSSYKKNKRTTRYMCCNTTQTTS